MSELWAIKSPKNGTVYTGRDEEDAWKQHWHGEYGYGNRDIIREKLQQLGYRAVRVELVEVDEHKEPACEPSLREKVLALTRYDDVYSMHSGGIERVENGDYLLRDDVLELLEIKP